MGVNYLFREVQSASPEPMDHNIFSMAILWLKKKVAPERQKVWNLWTTDEAFLNFRICLRASLTWVSVTCLIGNLDVAKRVAQTGDDLNLRRAWRARTGHNYMLSRRVS